MSPNFRIGLISIYVIENNGIRFLASKLRRQGFPVFEYYFKDYVHHHFVPPTPAEYGRLIDLIREHRIDLVGLSLRAGAYLPVAVEITRRIKEELGIVVMWGGPHVSLAPESCLDRADFLVVGEGEQAACDVAMALEEKKSIESIENVWLKKGDQVIRNPLRPLNQNLDEIAFRDFHSDSFKFFIEGKDVRRGEPMKNERLYPMLTSRGCLYNCAFCDVSGFRRLYHEDPGSFFRWRSVENCLAELDVALTTFPKIRRIRFDDELFVPDMEWIREFAEKYPARVGLPFEILSDPRCLDEERVAILARAGLDRVMIGIQGAEEVNRRLYDRPASDEKVIRLSEIFHRHKVRGVFQVIVDDPETTLDDKKRLLELLLKLRRPYDLYMFSLCHFPGTKRTAELIDRGCIDPKDVEGENNKVLTQFMADFSYPRPAEDAFFLALNQLANKRLIPRGLIFRLAESERLMKSPGPIVRLAKIANLSKLLVVGIQMLLRGEVAIRTVRRWIHIFDSPST